MTPKSKNICRQSAPMKFRWLQDAPSNGQAKPSQQLCHTTPRTIQPMSSYPFLLIHMGTKDIVKRDFGKKEKPSG